MVSVSTSNFVLELGFGSSLSIFSIVDLNFMAASSTFYSAATFYTYEDEWVTDIIAPIGVG